jgi:hypothetical protein
MGTVTTKEHARELVDLLEPPQVEAAVRFLESMVNEASTPEAPKKRHRQDESEWMATHEAELNAHRGEWVVIEGSQMIAADPDCLTAHNKATEAGIKVPFLYRVPEDDLPFAGV